MTFTKLMLAMACLVPVMLVAEEGKVPQGGKVTPEAMVTQLLSKDLTKFPGKEGLMITVDCPPGSSDPVHRHNAYAFVYVLEGSVVMQLRDGKQVTLTPGQTSMKAQTMFMSSAGMRALPSQQNLWCSW